MARLRHPPQPERRHRLIANPGSLILGLGDSLALAPAQRAALQLIADSLELQTTPAPSGPARIAGQETVRPALERARAVLPPEQWSELPDALKAPAAADRDTSAAPRP